jgi:hypothetical protein
MIRAGVHEETEDKICHFYGGLRTEIQDIIDYKEYNTINHLFQLAMLAEKELQGRQPIRLKSSFTPHHTSMTHSTSHAPGTAHFSATPSTSRVPSTSTAPPPCHTRFLCQNRVLIVCMTQDQIFHTYGQKCSQITKCHNIEYNYYINNVFKD